VTREKGVKHPSDGHQSGGRKSVWKEGCKNEGPPQTGWTNPRRDHLKKGQQKDKRRIGGHLFRGAWGAWGVGSFNGSIDSLRVPEGDWNIKGEFEKRCRPSYNKKKRDVGNPSTNRRSLEGQD